MKTFLRTITVILLMLMLLCFAGCGAKESGPEKTVKQLETAINHYDLDGILGCLDDDYAQVLRLLTSLSFGKNDTSPQKLLNLLQKVIPSLPYIPGTSISTSDLPSVQLSVAECNVSGDTADLTVDGTLHLGSDNHSFRFALEMKESDTGWVITGLK